MSFFNKTHETCIFATDFHVLDEKQKAWREKCSRRMECYKKYDELIEYLEDSLEILTDLIDQKKILKQIKKLKKLRNFYTEPAILSVYFDENYNQDLELETSVLKVKKRENYE